MVLVGRANKLGCPTFMNDVVWKGHIGVRRSPPDTQCTLVNKSNRASVRTYIMCYTLEPTWWVPYHTVVLIVFFFIIYNYMIKYSIQ